MKKDKLLKLNDYVLDKKIRIEGTQFDRRRKLSRDQVKTMQKLYRQGKALSELAVIFHVSVSTVRYHCDEQFKDYTNGMRAFYAFNTRTDNKERIAYKKLLIKNNLI